MPADTDFSELEISFDMDENLMMVEEIEESVEEKESVGIEKQAEVKESMELEDDS